MEANQSSLAPHWNIVSVALPVFAAAIAAAVLASSSSNDYASGIGSVLKALIAVGAICVLGEAAAIAALVRGERMAGLSVIGAILNLAVIVPALYLASRVE